jgi:hypothetical protein
MPTINVSQADFEAVAGAAWEAKFNHKEDAAAALDKIARKINCALSAQPYDPRIGNVGRLTWRDMPGTFDAMDRAKESVADAP